MNVKHKIIDTIRDENPGNLDITAEYTTIIITNNKPDTKNFKNAESNDSNHPRNIDLPRPGTTPISKNTGANIINSDDVRL